MNRHAMRGLIVQSLYHLEVGVNELDDVTRNVEEFVLSLKEKALNNPELKINAEIIEREFTIEAYYNTTIEGILANLETIDKLISDHLEGWSINRLNKVDKAILRLAVFEMMTTQTDHRILINEAIELTKNYADTGDRKAPNFNNRLLDKISQNLPKK